MSYLTYLDNAADDEFLGFLGGETKAEKRARLAREKAAKSRQKAPKPPKRQRTIASRPQPQPSLPYQLTTNVSVYDPNTSRGKSSGETPPFVNPSSIPNNDAPPQFVTRVNAPRVGILDKFFDFGITREKINADRDVALAQTGAQQQQQTDQTGLIRLPARTDNPNVDDVSDAGAKGGRAVGDLLNKGATFVKDNLLVCLAVAIGGFLYLQPPPKRGGKTG